MVVLVDDNAMTVKLATYMFQEAGWQVHGFTSAERALEALREIEPDVIVTDFRMPGMSGPDFLLRADTLHELTPKLVMTAYGDEPWIQDQLRKAGVKAVSKTRGLTEVLAAAEELASVRQALKRKSQPVCTAL